MTEKPKIVYGYTNDKKISYSDLRNLCFSSDKSFGKLIHATKKTDSNSFSLSVDGVFIYENEFLKDKALRIYKNALYEGSSAYKDDKLVYSLIQKQNKVKLTDFPTGIVTYEDRIIGQEIPYYKNAITLLEYTKLNKDKIPTKNYLEVLKILKEMLDNSICYADVHASNFLIVDNKMKVIDFESNLVSIDEIYNYQIENMTSNFTSLTSKINEICGISYDTRKMYQMNDLNLLEEYILEEDKKIRRNIKQ